MKEGDIAILGKGEVQMEKSELNTIPVWKKYTLTIQEAAVYFHIGEKKLRKLVEENTDADYVIMNGNRMMIKRKLFEKFIDETTVV